MSDASGICWINERDVWTDFGLVVTGLSGFPGIISMAPRLIPLLQGPEMNGALIDPALFSRQPAKAQITGRIEAASLTAAIALLDNLKAQLAGGEVSVRTVYSSSRYCLCAAGGDVSTVPLDGKSQTALNGIIQLTISLTIKDGLAYQTAPDGYGLSTVATPCPVGTAESRPVITLSTGGSATSVVNPIITVLNAAGDPVQSQSFVGTIAQNDFWRVDSANAQISKSIGGAALVDGMALWPTGSGDFVVLRPSDAWYESAAWASIILSASSGTPVGDVVYLRAYH